MSCHSLIFLTLVMQMKNVLKIVMKAFEDTYDRLKHLSDPLVLVVSNFFLTIAFIKFRNAAIIILLGTKRLVNCRARLSKEQ